MLNRLYIVIGLLAIAAIAAAFIVPRFIQWGDYRDRMQLIAGEVLGAPVEIAGDIDFSLLPQPRLVLTDVNVGVPAAPTLRVAAVEAEFSLLDFLRDRYLITKLVLSGPSLEMRVDEGGNVVSGIDVPDQVSAGNVAVAAAQLVDGTVLLSDSRSGTTVLVADIDGELRMDALRGPFGFQGRGVYEGEAYDARVATTALDEQGTSQLTLLVEPASKRFTLSAEGRLTAAARPAFEGTASLRIEPPPQVEGEEFDAGRGDFVLTGRVEASSSRILLPEYTVVPDENRAAARLTGAADVTLGAAQSFNAVVSGGVLALPPRDATEDQAQVPYEFIRLLDELDVPLAPGIAGTVNVDITELNLRAVSLRGIRADLSTDGRSWSIDTFAAQLPGNARLGISGELSAVANRPNFQGEVRLEAPRPDLLAQLWRRPSGDQRPVNLPASLAASLALVGETVSLSNGRLTLADTTHAFSAEIGFEPATRHLNLRADLGSLNSEDSAALVTLLPDAAGDAQFAATFPKGAFAVSAASATVLGLEGRGLGASGFWEGGVLALESLSAEDLGGASFDAQLTAFGTVDRPEFSGSADVKILAGDAPALEALYDRMQTPAPVRQWLERWMPAELGLELGAPTGEGGQNLSVEGTAGATDITIAADFGSGLLRALSGRVTLRVDAVSADAATLADQLGLGGALMSPGGAPARAVLALSGTAANSFETTLRLESGGDSLGFSGNVVSSDLERITGNGNLQASLTDASAIATAMGASGISLPALSGSARVDFEGLDNIRLSNISGSSNGEPVSGNLEWSRGAGDTEVTGQLNLGLLTPAALLAVLAGPAATVPAEDSVWPVGPFDGGRDRRTAGRIGVSAEGIVLGDETLVTGVSFSLGWDARSVRIRNLDGAVGEGAIKSEVSICCADALPLKQLTARISLDGITLGDIVPAAVADVISGTLDATVRLAGTGDSLASIMEGMTGEGTYEVAGASIAGLNPAAFDAVATLDSALDLEPGEMRDKVIEELAGSSFAAERVAGSFTIAGGVIRSPNLAIDGEGAGLFGSASLRLADLGLSGSFSMTPKSPSGPDGMLTDANAKITATVGGTLTAPTITFDVGGVVDTIMVKALEVEVARLEQLRAEEEARAQAAAAERARLAAEEEARRVAEEEAARAAAEEEAARLAAEEEAARLAAEEEARRQAEQPPLQLQPGFNLNPQESPNLF